MRSALGAKLRAELREGAVVISNAYAIPSRWLGTPKDSMFVATPTSARLGGLRDTSSHIFCYVQTADTRASASWQLDARNKRYRELAARLTVDDAWRRAGSTVDNERSRRDER